MANKKKKKKKEDTAQNICNIFHHSVSLFKGSVERSLLPWAIVLIFTRNRPWKTEDHLCTLFFIEMSKERLEKSERTPPVSWRPWALAYSRDRPYNFSCLSAVSKNRRFRSFFSALGCHLARKSLSWQVRIPAKFCCVWKFSCSTTVRTATGGHKGQHARLNNELHFLHIVRNSQQCTHRQLCRVKQPRVVAKNSIDVCLDIVFTENMVPRGEWFSDTDNFLSSSLQTRLINNPTHWQMVYDIWHAAFQSFLISMYNFGQKKFFTIENYLLVRNFLKHTGFHLFYPLQSFWAKKIFYYREYYWLVRHFCITLGFPCGFTVSAESPVYFGRKV